MATFHERYLAGEHEQVWKELVALGPGVRHEFYLDDALSVARETMRRVRQNVDLIFPRLHELGYEFRTQKSDLENRIRRSEQMFDVSQFKLNPGMASAFAAIPGFEGKMQAMLAGGMTAANPNFPTSPAIQRLQESIAMMKPRMDEMRENLKARAAAAPVYELPWQDRNLFDPPTATTPGELDQLEARIGGPLPLSLRAWYELVGGVSFMGKHEALDGPDDSDDVSDPLVIDPLPSVLHTLGEESEEDDEDEDGTLLELAPDDLHKADISGGAPYAIRVPNPAADARFEYEWHNTNFVPYLRHVFAWGGFPGIERRATKPEKELKFLTNGLLAF